MTGNAKLINIKCSLFNDTEGHIFKISLRAQCKGDGQFLNFIYIYIQMLSIFFS